MADMQPQGEVRPHPDGEITHEANRVQVRGILGFALALIVLAGVIHLVLAFVMQRFSKEEAKLQDSKAASVRFGRRRSRAAPARQPRRRPGSFEDSSRSTG